MMDTERHGRIFGKNIPISGRCKGRMKPPLISARLSTKAAALVTAQKDYERGCACQILGCSKSPVAKGILVTKLRSDLLLWPAGCSFIRVNTFQAL